MMESQDKRVQLVFITKCMQHEAERVHLITLTRTPLPERKDQSGQNLCDSQHTNLATRTRSHS